MILRIKITNFGVGKNLVNNICSHSLYRLKKRHHGASYNTSVGQIKLMGHSLLTHAPDEFEWQTVIHQCLWCASAVI